MTETANPRYIASLPMYNVTPELAMLWQDFLADVLRAARVEAQIVEPGDDLYTFWREPALLLSQTCGYPLTHGLAGQVQLVATPSFDAPGCVDSDYSSVLLTRDATRFNSPDSWRGARVAFNQDDSNSGMNVLRHTIARHAQPDSPFFSEVVRTGSHLGSMRALAENRADVTAIDCVTYAFVQDMLPGLAAQMTQTGYSAASPGLPLIASRNVPVETVMALRNALDVTLTDSPARAKRLRLTGFTTLTIDDYTRITALEEEARAAGYAHLA
ncbi:PhnD/SsuA/transferrin family substrate-binding protein [Paraburkholderia sp.]|uniref:phosphate/phosphite/phosphonate ABC transporter substrate-binding protein n=1 Tax=Paraburkholderia sp. TaxID=1926495 RepID=UPI00238560B4|nr:PhnD/SsuA/transferrin family substrate-binding protein [Paraburkholderia sp.]MDE1182602.1 PhnD/SsuA/transferrin family substrate-binding protein [Paraburkholderia sp.]